MRYHAILISGLFLIISCGKSTPETEENDPAPSNLTLSADVSTDGSGSVAFTATADNAFSYEFFFNAANSNSSKFSSNGKINHIYSFSGDYTVKVKAYDLSGTQSIVTSTNISIEVRYEIPQALMMALTNGSTRNWVWQKDVNGHLGVGPVTGSDPIWYQAQPFEKEMVGCFYNDVMTFTKDGDQILYNYTNNGQTYFNRGEVNAAIGADKPEEDRCYDWTAGDTKALLFYDVSSALPVSTNISFSIENGGFLSYYLGSSDYEIIGYTDSTIYVRAIQVDDAGNTFAWYHRFIAEDVADFGETNIEYELMWADEFDGDGVLDATYWTYEIGNGQNGWGNQEKQYYTDRLDNAIVRDGTLKIIAKKDDYAGSEYTSARVITKDKLEFTYGKVEFRAILPKGRGTWPALWLLGHNIDVVGWPACGEIDVMEHVGREENRVSAALHTPSSFGATVNYGATIVDGATDNFHVYELEWTPNQLYFRVDGQTFYAYNPPEKNANTYPFDKNFFIIMNVALGGTLGGTIGGSFEQGIMEVDYVRVYGAK